MLIFWCHQKKKNIIHHLSDDAIISQMLMVMMVWFGIDDDGFLIVWCDATMAAVNYLWFICASYLPASYTYDEHNNSLRRCLTANVAPARLAFGNLEIWNPYRLSLAVYRSWVCPYLLDPLWYYHRVILSCWFSVHRLLRCSRLSAALDNSSVVATAADSLSLWSVS